MVKQVLEVSNTNEYLGMMQKGFESNSFCAYTVYRVHMFLIIRRYSCLGCDKKIFASYDIFPHNMIF